MKQAVLTRQDRNIFLHQLTFCLHFYISCNNTLWCEINDILALPVSFCMGDYQVVKYLQLIAYQCKEEMYVIVEYGFLC